MRALVGPFALCLTLALSAVGCSSIELPPVDEGDGGSGGVIDPGDGCDDPADICNGGVCPFEEVDCDTAAANYVTQCTDPGCGLQNPSTGLCNPLEEAKARCLEGKRARPSDNVLWSCMADHAACGQEFNVCVLGTCNPE